tara:strand:+ start:1063 stop:1245 length:183 start_codon:yes stop_codon:yes gene_type:complete
MSKDNLGTIVDNTFLLGTHVKELKKELIIVKDNQKVLQQDITQLSFKLDKIIELLKQNSH